MGAVRAEFVDNLGICLFLAGEAPNYLMAACWRATGAILDGRLRVEVGVHLPTSLNDWVFELLVQLITYKRAWRWDGIPRCCCCEAVGLPGVGDASQCVT
jgi:hypothetical protein